MFSRENCLVTHRRGKSFWCTPSARLQLQTWLWHDFGWNWMSFNWFKLVSLNFSSNQLVNRNIWSPRSWGGEKLTKKIWIGREANHTWWRYRRMNGTRRCDQTEWRWRVQTDSKFLLMRRLRGASPCHRFRWFCYSSWCGFEYFCLYTSQARNLQVNELKR